MVEAQLSISSENSCSQSWSITGHLHGDCMVINIQRGGRARVPHEKRTATLQEELGKVSSPSDEEELGRGSSGPLSLCFRNKARHKAENQNPGNPEHSWQGTVPPAAISLYSSHRGQLIARVLLQHPLTPSHRGCSIEMLQHLSPATSQAQNRWDFHNAALSEHSDCPWKDVLKVP